MVAEEDNASRTNQEVEHSPLEEQCENNLLKENADGKMTTNADDIFEVFKNGEVGEAELLVEKYGLEYLSVRDCHGYTPAHWVALNGNVDMMRFLIECNAPIDLPCLGIQGPRPIHWACRKGYADVVQVLLQTGVGVNVADFKGLTPLMTACMYGRTATASFLLGMGALNHLTDINGDTALHWAAYKGHADLMRLLMYSGVELQKTDNFGSTPLHLACLSGNTTCVRLLCEKNSLDLDPKDKNGKTPIMLAQSHRHHEIVKILYNEIKKKSRWIPSVSEIWGMLFGGAGDTKGPLLMFLFSVLLWGYPMYMIRVKCCNAKRRLTRAAAFSVETIDESTPIEMLEIRFGKLETTWTEFSACHNEILEQTEETEVDEIENEFSAFETKYFVTNSQIVKAISERVNSDEFPAI
ncbi:uncharacterized protein LOC129905318 [Episyrphus balteatus]|uniref:uncharacterized protein LOC129905318 n=1 Tax=Episyrphus balteatus TaxID=286459 RepID=UPI002485C7F2|nr:uncharacterized protein LOC129905318 [Episyrphus balteatus]